MLAKQSKYLSEKERQELVSQSLSIKENAKEYLDLYSINLNGNGKIVTINSPMKPKTNAEEIKFSSLDSINSSVESVGKTGVLISCSHHKAGGGWLSGSMAQEESISRATTWAVQAGLNEFSSWYKQDSWLGQGGSLVIDGLMLFNQQHQELPEPREIVFAGVAAPNKSKLNKDKYWDSADGLSERKNALVKNIVCALTELNNRGVKNVILCAFGTNVFGWKLEESISVLHEASKYASSNLNLICAMASKNKKAIAEEIYNKLIMEENTKSNRFRK